MLAVACAAEFTKLCTQLISAPHFLTCLDQACKCPFSMDDIANRPAASSEPLYADSMSRVSQL